MNLSLLVTIITINYLKQISVAASLSYTQMKLDSSSSNHFLLPRRQLYRHEEQLNSDQNLDEISMNDLGDYVKAMLFEYNKRSSKSTVAPTIKEVTTLKPNRETTTTFLSTKSNYRKTTMTTSTIIKTPPSHHRHANRSDQINEFMVSVVRPHNRTHAMLPRDKVCAHSLKQEDGHDWSCKVQYSTSQNEKKVPLFCLCAYEHDCSLREHMHLSRSYATQLERDNRLKGVDRGADWQCESVLRTRTKLKRWSCVLKSLSTDLTTLSPSPPNSSKDVNYNSNNHINNTNDELFCDCFHKKKCKHTRMVDFYD